MELFWREAWGTLSTCKAVFTPNASCCKMMTCLPSPLYFSFSLCIEDPWPWKLFTSPLQAMTLIASPSWSLFWAKLLMCFSQLTSASLTNAHKQWRCKSLQPLLALAIAQHSWCCWAGIFRGLLQQSRLQTDWDMFGGSAMFATRGGWKTETLYGNLLTLKTAWLLAKSVKSQHNFSKPPVQPFIIYLSTAVRGIFLSVTLVHHLP